ncbi:hypothetical protein GIB67_026440 [Kingdonia uniflora]|uniref:Uncharacterized protein n=1 Tax=Kingdonia uniflora TaxID=39325 RepID=A0A7J7P6P8_9MAGN|nr:hypothetical protein GIB67_026440 [Kingdonia uniflora]
MVFFLKQLKIYYVLSDIYPTTPAETMSDTAKKALEKIQKWKDDNNLCRHHILNSLTDALYNQFKKNTNNAKDLWEGIRTVYVADETSTKKFQVSNYIDYVMVDSKPILEQVQEFQVFANSIVSAGMKIDANFHVSVIISKLPSSISSHDANCFYQQSRCIF